MGGSLNDIKPLTPYSSVNSFMAPLTPLMLFLLMSGRMYFMAVASAPSGIITLPLSTTLTLGLR